MKGGGGFLRRSDVSTEVDRPRRAFATSSRTRCADASSGRRGSVPSNLSFSPSNEESRAEKGGGRLCPRAVASTRPVLDRDERLDLAFALADDPQRDRLDAPGGQTPPDLLPEEVRDLVADEPVDDAARLLRVDEAPSISPAASIAARTAFFVISLNRTRRKIVFPAPGFSGFLQVPGDRLALAVGVGRQIDVVGRLGRLLQLVDASFPCRRAPRRSARSRCSRSTPRPLLAAGRGRGRRRRGP